MTKYGSWKLVMLHLCDLDFFFFFWNYISLSFFFFFLFMFIFQPLYLYLFWIGQGSCISISLLNDSVGFLCPGVYLLRHYLATVEWPHPAPHCPSRSSSLTHPAQRSASSLFTVTPTLRMSASSTPPGQETMIIGTKHFLISSAALNHDYSDICTFYNYITTLLSHTGIIQQGLFYLILVLIIQKEMCKFLNLAQEITFSMFTQHWSKSAHKCHQLCDGTWLGLVHNQPSHSSAPHT